MLSIFRCITFFFNTRQTTIQSYHKLNNGTVTHLFKRSGYQRKFISYYDKNRVRVRTEPSILTITGGVKIEQKKSTENV